LEGLPVVPDGNTEQTRIVAEQVADAAITRFVAMRKIDREQALTGSEATPPFVKWFAGAIAGLGSTALIGLGIWLVTSVSSMSETLARMDERMKGNDSSVQSELNELRRRVTAVELRQQGDTP
jgi:type IV secretory pathway TrbD component